MTRLAKLNSRAGSIFESKKIRRHLPVVNAYSAVVSGTFCLGRRDILSRSSCHRLTITHLFLTSAQPIPWRLCIGSSKLSGRSLANGMGAI